MYQIKQENNILYDLRDKDLFLENPELELEINKVGTLKFGIYPDHPYFNNINKLSSVITVLKDNNTIFKGRVISDEQGLYNNKNIECEGVLGYLNDSIVRPYEFSGTPAQWFTSLINTHNSQVTEEQKLKIGTITVTDPNDYIVRSSVDYASTWDIINEDLIDHLGGYLRVRYEADGTYVDYLADFSDTSTQIIELGENLIDVLVKNNAADVYTVVIPLGAQIESDNENKKRLDIKSVNNNLDYLVNQTALDLYGWIVAPVENTTWDDVTLATNLKTKGTNYLNNEAVMLKSSLEVSAIDLNIVDTDNEAFFIYEYVRFISSIHNINQTYLLNKITIPLADPASMKITLGKEENSLTGIQLGTKRDTDNLINRVGFVEKNYEVNNEKIGDLENAIEYFSIDLSQYNITIPTNASKKPLETKNYDVNFYGYYKGNQVTPNVSISGSNTGITTSKTNTYIRFAVSNYTIITNTLNEYTITFTYTVDSTTYTVVKIIDIALALQGSAGTNGTNGTNGKSAYQIWLDNGNTGTEEQYLASLKGEQGIAGTPGTSTYFYVRYSANSNGNPMTTAPQTNTKYMGVATTTSSTAPTSYSAYTWSDVKGKDGLNGSPGTAGADGISSYLHIKYSDDGYTFTSNSGETPGRYRGELVDTNVADSTTFSDYTWYDMSLLVEDELNEIRQEVQTNITSITQNQEEILMTALQDYVSTGDFETFRNTVTTQFVQTANDFSFNFTNLTSQINTLNGNTQQQFQEILKYIRFIDGTINLGEVGNPIILKIENDEVAFYQNGGKVAYLSNSKMLITDAEILNSLTIGIFAWKPRTNGNLSLVKVGGNS